MRINLIAAVGTNGQLGLRGQMPWGIDRADMEWFRENTRNGLVVVGYNTFPSVAHIESTLGRKLLRDDSELTPKDVRRIAEQCGSEAVWIAGGAKTYRRWIPHVDRFYISRIAYTGPADTWMPDITWSPSR